MRHPLAALLAMPMLIGAAPQTAQTPGAVAQCQLPLEEARQVVARMNIMRSSGEDPAAEGGRSQFFSGAGVTVLGQTATDFAVHESIDAGTHRVLIRASLPAAYPEMRAAMLALHGKTTCDAHESTEPGKLGCMVHVRAEGPDNQRDVDMILFEFPDKTTVAGCIYSYRE